MGDIATRGSTCAPLAFENGSSPVPVLPEAQHLGHERQVELVGCLRPSKVLLYSRGSCEKKNVIYVVVDKAASHLEERAFQQSRLSCAAM